jgi:hypothetical protein
MAVLNKLNRCELTDVNDGIGDAQTQIRHNKGIESGDVDTRDLASQDSPHEDREILHSVFMSSFCSFIRTIHLDGRRLAQGGVLLGRSWVAVVQSSIVDLFHDCKDIIVRQQGKDSVGWNGEK